jgi:CDP-paratose synthetase
MKVLVTGATGFLGSHLTRSLVKEGHEVIILKRSFSDTWRISDVYSKLTAYDLDKHKLEQVFTDCGPINAIIHTATMYDRKDENSANLLYTNVYFPMSLLETASTHGTKLFINTDTFSASSILKGNSLAGYNLSKYQLLQWLKIYSQKQKITTVNVRLEHPFGPNDNQDKFIPYIIKSCQKNVPELKLSLGEQKRDFIYIDDVVSAFCLLLKQDISNFEWYREFQLGRGRGVTIRHLVELIHKNTNSKTLLNFGAIGYRDNEIMDSKANIQALLELGWESKISLEEGIEKILGEQR